MGVTDSKPLGNIRGTNFFFSKGGKKLLPDFYY
jgi:hypothetical protein